MPNLLKKTEFNPLYNFDRFDHLKAYEEAKDDEELATAFHKMLDAEEENETLTETIHSLIVYATDKNINAQMLVI